MSKHIKLVKIMLAISTLSGCMGVDPDDPSSAVGAAGVVTCPRNYLGDYCGNNGITNGDPKVVYACRNGVATVRRVCTTSCQIMPPGQNDRCAPRPITVSAANLTVLRNGNYNTAGNLLWANSGALQGGTSLALLAGSKVQIGTLTQVSYGSDPVGNCVPFVKATSGRTDGTANWVRGARAVDNCASVPVGTAVATFTSGGVYSGHVGYVAACTSASLTLWDENYVTALRVGRHAIPRTNSGSVSDAAAYYVVQAP